MQKQIDKLIIPSGLIRRAKTYSLVFDEDELYIINTGPAGREVITKNIIEDAVVSFVLDRIAKKVAEGEEKLKTLGVKQLANEKGNAFIEKNAIIKTEVKVNFFNTLILKINTIKGNFSFNCNAHKKEDIETFVKCLRE
ncbi:hypothetical protein A3J90_07315 [candidate division WOR-1 bacterium RIFOXYC2_FULL_37_10]|uniref:Uncharacterized protein n=1 Tax=candidate division WOR-1 bacterium RIFOXYB2_FULL_37_13 TaxID=1802579 RepID=A0A1F4SQ52_UNCSA|nr:MAG: hypothetical protein A2310_00935 [candidate division WOR-1 bacterium RIFOXYB2_FULL_37_13]OGC37246.1 MAG: hypothetical protein A3J90_07315 [candidate division WOR-1 bacterium RIFOXYC2_FULL_37_10]